VSKVLHYLNIGRQLGASWLFGELCGDAGLWVRTSFQAPEWTQACQ